MAVIDSAVLLLQAKNYSGSGDWLDESGNSHDGVISGATFSTDHFVFNGSTDIITVAHHTDLDFGLSDSFTIMAVVEASAVPPPNIEWIAGKKTDYAVGNAGYTLYVNTSSQPRLWLVDNSSNNAGDLAAALTQDTKQVAAGVRNVTDDDIEAFTDGTGSGSPATDPSTGTGPSNTVDFTIGKAPSSVLAWTGKIYAVALWASALSDADVATAGDELLTDTVELAGTISGVGATTVDLPGQLAAVISGASTVTSALTVATPNLLAGEIDGAATATALTVLHLDAFTVFFAE